MPSETPIFPPLRINALLIVPRARRESEYDQGTNQLFQDLTNKPIDISSQISHLRYHLACLGFVSESCLQGYH